MELKEKTVFQRMMASLLGTRQQLEAGLVLRREGSARAGRSKLGRLLRPMLRASVALMAFVAVPEFSAGLNGTGITACGDSTSTSVASCDSVSGDGGGFPRQNGRFGRDANAQLSKTGGGGAGFDFTRVCNSGELEGQGHCPQNPVLGNGTNQWAGTKDNVTGLTWEIKDVSGTRGMNNSYTWADLPAYVAAVNASALGGYSDWRLPTIKELTGIVDFSRLNPAIDPGYFPNTASAIYWSGTLDPSTSQTVWYVSFQGGNIAPAADMYVPRAVRLVRGDIAPTNQFTITDNGSTVTDSSTGLVWKRAQEMLDPSSPGTWIDRKDTFLWQAALQRAVNDRTGGYSDWRLPNIKELRSLIDETKHNPAIDTNFFPDSVIFSQFWSSSPALD